MFKTIKAAPHEQPANDLTNKSIAQRARECLQRIINIFGGAVVFVRLLGYSGSNQEYSLAKRPVDQRWTNETFQGHDLSDLVHWVECGGWVGARVPIGHIVVDVDDVQEGQIINDLLLGFDVRHHSIRTPNGYQFIFRDSGLITKQSVKMFTEYGFEVDYRLQNIGQIVIPMPNTEGRQLLNVQQTELDVVPFWFTPIFQLNVQKTRPFKIPIGEGSRNRTLFEHACRLRTMGRNGDQICKIINFMGSNLCFPSVDKKEIKTIIDSALKYKDGVLGVDRSRKQDDLYTNTDALSPDINTSVDQPKFHNTELGNAHRLVYYFGKDLRYCHSFGIWYIWDGQHWRADETGEIERKAKLVAGFIKGEALAEVDLDRRSALLKHAIRSESRQQISNMISLAQTEDGIVITPAELNRDQWKLNCLNGMIDLKTGQLLPHNREELLTNLTRTMYNPAMDCPNWMKFLNRIMQDAEDNERPEVVEYLQRAVGYSLTGSIKEQVMFVLYGSGKNGKSTFINVIKDMLGDYSRQSSTETFMVKQLSGGIPNDLARLQGARLVCAVESEEGKRLAESLIKQLTGGDSITARFLHKEFFEYSPTFKIFLVTNHKPQIRSSDWGIWRRLMLIPFTVTIGRDEEDKDLAEKLHDEMPGILKWAVEGCLKWQKEGLKAPLEIINATNIYREEMDTISQFVNECCFVNPLSKISSKDLYKAYLKWCEDNGQLPLAQAKFINRLKERMESMGHPITDSRTSTGRFWNGIGITNKTSLPDVREIGDTEMVDIEPRNNVPNMQVEEGKQLTIAADPHFAWEEGEL